MTDEQQIRIAFASAGLVIANMIIGSIRERLSKRTPYEWGKLLGLRTKRFYKSWSLRK